MSKKIRKTRNKKVSSFHIGTGYLFQAFDKKNRRHITLVVLVALLWVSVACYVYSSANFSVEASGPFPAVISR